MKKFSAKGRENELLTNITFKKITNIITNNN